ncbi:MAG: hypothetical protein LBS25_04285, partial [Candidatus Symbiothrix sp.]|nr:hypothetical protein [Candidatus Symbiothrix sp.]
MKTKWILFLTLFIALGGQYLLAEEKNWIDNPDFEDSWNDLNTPIWWTLTPSAGAKETSIVYSGSAALKITGSNLAKLYQSTDNIIPTQGETYDLIFQYYVVQSQGADDIRLNCAWNGGNVDATHDETVLKQSFSADENARWETKTVRTTAPKNAVSFDVAVGIPAGAIVIFDDFSFKKIDGLGPSMTVTPSTLSKVTTTVGLPVTFAKVIVETANLPEAVAVYITGANPEYFETDVTSIPTTQNTTEVTISYLPELAGNHQASISFEVPSLSTLFQSI